LDYDAVVVGAGLGGLACAAVLARAGLTVGVFEQHDVAGGFASSFTRGPYEVEVSLHMLDAVGPGDPNRAVLEDTGIASRIELQRGRWLRRELWPDQGIDLWIPHGVVGYVNALESEFPGSGDEVSAFFASCAHIHERCYAAIEDGRLSLERGSRRLHALLGQTAEQLIAEHVTHPGAAAALGTLATYHGLFAERLAAIPFALLMHGYHACGGYYPVGGSKALSGALVAVIEESGGAVHTSTPVEAIVCRRGRARGIVAAGQTVSARWVVSNISPLVTFGTLVSRDQVEPRYLARLDAMEVSGSFYRLTLGLDRRAQDLAPMAYETFVHDRSLSGRARPLPLTVTAPGVLREMEANYVSITTHAPSGQPRLDAEAKAHIRRDLLDGIEGTILPGLSEHVALTDLAHPATYERFTGSPGGATLGFAAIPSQSGPRRLHNVTPVRNLLQAGAWVFPGAGQTAAMLSGRLAAGEILRGVL
jgi:prolycopene isomerase